MTTRLRRQPKHTIILKVERAEQTPFHSLMYLTLSLISKGLLFLFINFFSLCREGKSVTKKCGKEMWRTKLIITQSEQGGETKGTNSKTTFSAHRPYLHQQRVFLFQFPVQSLRLLDRLFTLPLFFRGFVFAARGVYLQVGKCGREFQMNWLERSSRGVGETSEQRICGE